MFTKIGSIEGVKNDHLIPLATSLLKTDDKQEVVEQSLLNQVVFQPKETFDLSLLQFISGSFRGSFFKILPLFLKHSHSESWASLIQCAYEKEKKITEIIKTNNPDALKEFCKVVTEDVHALKPGETRLFFGGSTELKPNLKLGSNYDFKQIKKEILESVKASIQECCCIIEQLPNKKTGEFFESLLKKKLALFLFPFLDHSLLKDNFSPCLYPLEGFRLAGKSLADFCLEDHTDALVEKVLKLISKEKLEEFCWLLNEGKAVDKIRDEICEKIEAGLESIEESFFDAIKDQVNLIPDLEDLIKLFNYGSLGQIREPIWFEVTREENSFSMNLYITEKVANKLKCFPQSIYKEIPQEVLDSTFFHRFFSYAVWPNWDSEKYYSVEDIYLGLFKELSPYLLKKHQTLLNFCNVNSETNLFIKFLEQKIGCFKKNFTFLFELKKRVFLEQWQFATPLNLTTYPQAVELLQQIALQLKYEAEEGWKKGYISLKEKQETVAMAWEAMQSIHAVKTKASCENNTNSKKFLVHLSALLKGNEQSPFFSALIKELLVVFLGEENVCKVLQKVREYHLEHTSLNQTSSLGKRVIYVLKAHLKAHLKDQTGLDFNKPLRLWGIVFFIIRVALAILFPPLSNIYTISNLAKRVLLDVAYVLIPEPILLEWYAIQEKVFRTGLKLVGQEVIRLFLNSEQKQQLEALIEIANQFINSEKKLSFELSPFEKTKETLTFLDNTPTSSDPPPISSDSVSIPQNRFDIFPKKPQKKEPVWLDLLKELIEVEGVNFLFFMQELSYLPVPKPANQEDYWSLVENPEDALRQVSSAAIKINENWEKLQIFSNWGVSSEQRGHLIIHFYKFYAIVDKLARRLPDLQLEEFTFNAWPLIKWFYSSEFCLIDEKMQKQLQELFVYANIHIQDFKGVDDQQFELLALKNNTLLFEDKLYINKNFFSEKSDLKYYRRLFKNSHLIKSLKSSFCEEEKIGELLVTLPFSHPIFQMHLVGDLAKGFFKGIFPLYKENKFYRENDFFKKNNFYKENKPLFVKTNPSGIFQVLKEYFPTFTEKNAKKIKAFPKTFSFSLEKQKKHLGLIEKFSWAHLDFLSWRYGENTEKIQQFVKSLISRNPVCQEHILNNPSDFLSFRPKIKKNIIELIKENRNQNKTLKKQNGLSSLFSQFYFFSYQCGADLIGTLNDFANRKENWIGENAFASLKAKEKALIEMIFSDEEDQIIRAISYFNDHLYNIVKPEFFYLLSLVFSHKNLLQKQFHQNKEMAKIIGQFFSRALEFACFQDVKPRLVFQLIQLGVIAKIQSGQGHIFFPDFSKYSFKILVFKQDLNFLLCWPYFFLEPKTASKEEIEQAGVVLIKAFLSKQQSVDFFKLAEAAAWKWAPTIMSALKTDVDLRNAILTKILKEEEKINQETELSWEMGDKFFFTQGFKFEIENSDLLKMCLKEIATKLKSPSEILSDLCGWTIPCEEWVYKNGTYYHNKKNLTLKRLEDNKVYLEKRDENGFLFYFDFSFKKIVNKFVYKESYWREKEAQKGIQRVMVFQDGYFLGFRYLNKDEPIFNIKEQHWIQQRSYKKISLEEAVGLKPLAHFQDPSSICLYRSLDAPYELTHICFFNKDQELIFKREEDGKFYLTGKEAPGFYIASQQKGGLDLFSHALFLRNEAGIKKIVLATESLPIKTLTQQFQKQTSFKIPPFFEKFFKKFFFKELDKWNLFNQKYFIYIIDEKGFLSHEKPDAYLFLIAFYWMQGNFELTRHYLLQLERVGRLVPFDFYSEAFKQVLCLAFFAILNDLNSLQNSTLSLRVFSLLEESILLKKGTYNEQSSPFLEILAIFFMDFHFNRYLNLKPKEEHSFLVGQGLTEIHEKIILNGILRSYRSIIYNDAFTKKATIKKIIKKSGLDGILELMALSPKLFNRWEHLEIKYSPLRKDNYSKRLKAFFRNFLKENPEMPQKSGEGGLSFLSMLADKSELYQKADFLDCNLVEASLEEIPLSFDTIKEDDLKKYFHLYYRLAKREEKKKDFEKFQALSLALTRLHGKHFGPLGNKIVAILRKIINTAEIVLKPLPSSDELYKSYKNSVETTKNVKIVRSAFQMVEKEKMKFPIFHTGKKETFKYLLKKAEEEYEMANSVFKSNFNFIEKFSQVQDITDGFIKNYALKFKKMIIAPAYSGFALKIDKLVDGDLLKLTSASFVALNAIHVYKKLEISYRLDQVRQKSLEEAASGSLFSQNKAPLALSLQKKLQEIDQQADQFFNTCLEKYFQKERKKEMPLPVDFLAEEDAVLTKYYQRLNLSQKEFYESNLDSYCYIFNPSLSLSQLKNRVKEEKELLEKTLHQQKETILNLIFKPKKIEDYTNYYNIKEKEEVFATFLVALFLDNDQFFKKTQLSDQEKLFLKEGLYCYSLQGTLLHRMERILDLIDQAEKEKSALDQLSFELSRKRAYSFNAPSLYLRGFLAFEWNSKKMLFEAQAKRFQEMLSHPDESARLVLDLSTGSGKTAFGIPMTAFCEAKWTIIPEALAATQIPEISKVAQEVFHQLSTKITINRKIPLTKEHLFANLQVLLRKDIIFSCKKDVQALQLRFLEELKNGKASDELLFAYMHLLAWLRKNMKANIDEAHKIFRRSEELNHPLNQKKRLKTSYILVLKQVVFAFLEQEKKQKIDETNYETLIRPQLAESLASYFCIPSSQKACFIQYLLDKSNDFEHSQKEEIDLARGCLRELLPHALEKRLFIDYGPPRACTTSKDCTTDEFFKKESRNKYAIPYKDGEPAEQSTIKNPFEAALKTFLMMARQRLNQEEVEELGKHLFNLAKKEMTKKINCLLDETYVAKKLFAWSKGALRLSEWINTFQNFETKKINQAQWQNFIEKVIRHINENDEAVLFYSSHFICNKISYYADNLSCDSYDFASMWKSFYSYTGSPNRDETFPDQTKVLWDLKSAGEFIAFAKQKGSLATIEAPSAKDSLEAILTQLFQKGSLNSALIDGGALFQGLDNCFVAEAMLTHLEKQEGDLCGVVFYDKEKKLVILEKKGRSPVDLHLSQIPLDKRWTYFDYSHIFGADIPQHAKAGGVVTIGKKMSFEELVQASGRMRGLKTKEQTLVFVINKTRIKSHFSNVHEVINFVYANEAKTQGLENYLAARKQIRSEVRTKVMDAMIFSDNISFVKSCFKEFESLFILKAVENPSEFYGSLPSNILTKKALSKLRKKSFECIENSALFTQKEKEELWNRLEQIGENKSLPETVLDKETDVGLDQEVCQTVEQDQELEQDRELNQDQELEQDQNMEIQSFDPSSLLKIKETMFCWDQSLNYFSSSSWLKEGEDVNQQSCFQLLSVSSQVPLKGAFLERLWMTNNFLGILESTGTLCPLLHPKLKPVFQLLLVVDKNRKENDQLHSIALSQQEAKMWRQWLAKNRLEETASPLKIGLFELALGEVVDTGSNPLVFQDLISQKSFFLDWVRWNFLAGRCNFSFNQKELDSFNNQMCLNAQKWVEHWGKEELKQLFFEIQARRKESYSLNSDMDLLFNSSPM